MKRGISLLVVLCLLVSLCSTIFVNAAPPLRVTEINVTGVVAPVAGQPAITTGITCDVPGVTISAEWYRCAVEGGYYGESGPFENGNLYRLVLDLTADGIYFDQETKATINGVEAELFTYASGHVEMEAYYPLGLTPITKLDITGIGDTSIGSPIAMDGIQAENAIMQFCNWSCDGERINGQHVFEDGKDYSLYTQLYPMSGYYFAPDLELTYDGHPCDFLQRCDPNMIFAYRYVNYGGTEIEKVILDQTLPEEIVPGPVPQVEVGVSTGEATVTDVYWTDENMNPVTAFEQNKVYYLNVKLVPNKGYRFGEHLSIRDKYSQYADRTTGDKNAFVGSWRYSLLPKAERVEFTVDGVGLGNKIADVTYTVANADGELTVEVRDEDYNHLKENAVFEEGKGYHFTLKLDSDTVEFTEDTTVIVNGKEKGKNIRDGVLHTSHYVSYKEFIEEVFLTVPEPVAGQPAGELTIPEDANSYYIDQYEWRNLTDGTEMEIGDIFQYRTSYQLQVDIDAARGYDFYEGTRIYVNGKKLDKEVYCGDSLYVPIDYRFGGGDIGYVNMQGTRPDQIEVGAVPQVDVREETEGVVIDEIYWTDRDGNKVTAFEKNMLYHLNVAMVTEPGYQFEDVVWPTGDYSLIWESEVKFVGDTYIVSWRYNSLLPWAEKLDISVSGTQIGASFDDVSVKVTNMDDVAVTWKIRDVDTDEYLEEGTFQNGKGYEIIMELRSDFYRFSGRRQVTEITLTGGDIGNYSSWADTEELAELGCYISYMTRLNKVEVTIPEPAIGQEPVVPTVSNGANYFINSDDPVHYYWTDETTGEELQPGDTFQDGHAYRLDYWVVAKDGYDFADEEEIEFYVNGEQIWDYFYTNADHQYIYCDYYCSFEPPEVEEVVLDGELPEKIVPGAAPNLTFGVMEGEATVSEVYWTDAEQNRVTTFQNGKAYYLTVALAVKDGYRFTESTSIYSKDYDLFEIVSCTGDTYIAQYRYSLRPKAEKLDVTITGVELGKPVADVVAQVTTPDMKIDYLHITDDWWNEVSGVFEQGKAYAVSLEVISDRYDFDSDMEVTVNGQEMVCSIYETKVYIYYYVSFRTHIDKVEISVPQPVAGQEPGVPTVPADACYVIEYYEWYDEKNYEYLEQGDKFQDGGRYFLLFSVSAKAGYDFSKETTVTVNGQKVGNVGIGTYDTDFEVGWTWSLAKPIQKIELPAIPDKIKPGAAPKINPIEKTEYTVTGYWRDVEKNEPVTTFKDGGSYILMYNVEPKPGYELDMKNTKVLAGGKDYAGIWSGNYDSAVAGKVFSLSKKVVDRIDLTITAPALGQKPAEITAAQSDKYGLVYGDWLEGDTGSIYDNPDYMDGRFTTGKYYFAEAQITAKNGYVITEDTQVYINGVKVNPSVFWAFGSSARVAQIYQPLGDSAGDMNGDGTVNNKDVEYLLWHTLFPANYPISKNVDFNGDGQVNNKDVEYLLWHTLFPGNYPLNK